MSLHFVNINGARLNVDRMIDQAKSSARPKISNAPDEFHKGWRVVGHPPGALEAAKERAQKNDEEWDEGGWRSSTKPKPIRPKPYEVFSAAQDCATLAEKAGWIDVVLVEIKRGAA